PVADGGGAGASATPIAMVSDAGSGGPMTASAPELISDAASSGAVQTTQASAAGPTAQGVQARIAAEHAVAPAAQSAELIRDRAATRPDDAEQESGVCGRRSPLLSGGCDRLRGLLAKTRGTDDRRFLLAQVAQRLERAPMDARRPARTHARGMAGRDVADMRR